MKRLLMLGIVFMFITTSFGYDVLKEYNITDSQLPFVGTEQFLLQLEANQTLFFNSGNYSSEYVSLLFPNNYTFPENETNYTLSINYTVDNINIFQDSVYNESVFINNTYNNITTEILFKYNIDYVTVVNYTNITNNTITYKVDIIDDGYNITISSNTLPKNGTVKFALTGYPNTTGSITYCGDFLSCPSTFNYDTYGNATITIGYYIPYGQSWGSYTRVFAIQSNNTFKQGKIIFNVIEPQYVIEHYVYTDNCFLNKANMIRCVREQQEFDSKKLADFINQLLKEDKTMCPTVNETIKYVMQGEINEELRKLYQNSIKDLENSRNETSLLRAELKELRVDNSNLLQQKEVILVDSNKLVKDAQDMAFETKIKSDVNIKDQQAWYEDRAKFWTTFIVVAICLSLLISYLVYRVGKDNWW